MEQPADDFKDITFNCLNFPENELIFSWFKETNLLHIATWDPELNCYTDLAFNYEMTCEIRNLLTAILARMEE